MGQEWDWPPARRHVFRAATVIDPTPRRRHVGPLGWAWVVFVGSAGGALIAAIIWLALRTIGV